MSETLDLSRPWTDYTYVALDLETTGGYPVGFEICEFGAVKWKGSELESLQSLFKPKQAMSDFIVKIHGITNEMVEFAPQIESKISEIRSFLEGSIVLAHNAPFDLGFLAYDFERFLGGTLPTSPAFCTSLMARKLIPEAPKHRLQTLVQFLNLPKGTAHRALDDARACLLVGLECFKRLGDVSLQEALTRTNSGLSWSRFTLRNLPQFLHSSFIQAIEQKKDVDIVYEGGSVKGKPRRISPLGLVRNPEGDYVVGICHIDRTSKRFYLNQIKDASICLS